MSLNGLCNLEIYLFSHFHLSADSLIISIFFFFAYFAWRCIRGLSSARLMWIHIFIHILVGFFMNKQVADSLDLYCRELFGFEEICLLATLIIFVSQAIGGYCRYCHNAGSYPTIFMIIVRWSVLLESLFFGKFRLTSCANIIFGNVFCAARRFISFLDWTSLSYIWVIKQYFDDCVEIIVNIILLYGSGCLSDDHSFDLYQMGPFNVD